MFLRVWLMIQVLFNDTIFYNIHYGRMTASKEEVAFFTYDSSSMFLVNCSLDYVGRYFARLAEILLLLVHRSRWLRQPSRQQFMTSSWGFPNNMKPGLENEAWRLLPFFWTACLNSCPVTAGTRITCVFSHIHFEDSVWRVWEIFW